MDTLPIVWSDIFMYVQGNHSPSEEAFDEFSSCDSIPSVVPNGELVSTGINICFMVL